MWGWWCGSGVCGVNVGLVVWLVCVCVCGWWCGVVWVLAWHCFVGLVLCGVGDGSGEMCGVELCCSLAPETLAYLY